MESGSDNKKENNTKKKVTSKQIVAIIGIVLLVLLYIVTLVVAVTDNSGTGKWFMICIFATVAMPLLIWIYTWMYGKLTGRHTIADADHSFDPEVIPNTDNDNTD